MKIIKPVQISDAMMVSPPADPATAYSPAITYAAGDQVQYGHFVYQSVQSANTANQPDTSPLWWVKVRPTVAWAPFDGSISAPQTDPTSITRTLDIGQRINSLALFGLSCATANVQVFELPNTATPVYDVTVSMAQTLITDWYQYFYEPYAWGDQVVLFELPPVPSPRVIVTASGSTGGDVALGEMVVGTAYTLGDTQYGARSSLIDYSRKVTDEFGVTSVVQRTFAKRINASLLMPTGRIAQVQRLLTELRATPVVWVGVEQDEFNTYAPLATYGFYKDFSIDVQYATTAACSLEIEGLT